MWRVPFLNKLHSTPRAEYRHSLRVRGRWGHLAKAAVQREAKAKNAATDLMAAESPTCALEFSAARARSEENAALV